MTRKRKKGVLLWFSEEEYEGLRQIAIAHRKPVTTFTAELVKRYVAEGWESRAAHNAAVEQKLVHLSRTILDLHEGLCYATEKLLTPHRTVLAFSTDEELHDWVLAHVGRRS